MLPTESNQVHQGPLPMMAEWNLQVQGHCTIGHQKLGTQNEGGLVPFTLCL